jgi:tetratricopeptide (TPR) repeat protein/predicted Ser/Thr protein kinase
MIEPRTDADAETTSDHAVPADCDPFDRVAEEFAERCRRGESPSIAEYAKAHPEHAGRIRDLLPSVAMMERLKRRLRESRDDSAGLHEPALESLGEYRIVRELGRGGMGIVYEAYQESLARHVALKVIPRQGLLDAKRRQRFQREAMAIAQLHHTNIVPIFAVGEQDGLPYYAMQYIRGSGLDRLLEHWRRDGLVRAADHWRLVARIGVQAAEAVQYAHDQGILHRDVKPANLLIDEHQVVWITDFGLAKLAGRDDLTNSGDVVGTLRYLAPEALQGRNDHRGDIYSLGLTLYELLTLRLPFGDLSPSELLRCVTEEQPTRPRKLDRSIPLDLETIVLKATAREPGHRYATAGELADDLRSFLDDRPIRARRATIPARLGRWCRRNKVLAGVTAFAAASFLAALVFATVGYVSTNRALQKSEANLNLSLAALERLFETLIDPDDRGPFADGHEPPAPGGPGPRPAGDPGPPSPPPLLAVAGPPGEPEPPPDAGPPHARGMGPPQGGMPLPMTARLNERDAAVLESVLDFYDKFAERNETNSRLQGEAALAYRKVAAIYRWMGRDRDAEEPYNRSLHRFETLAAQHPSDAEYQYELARTIALDDQHGIDSAAPERSEPALRKGMAMVEQLAEQSPDKRVYVAALARWNGRLARILEDLGRSEEAEACYRASIARDEWLTDHVRDASIVHWVLASNRDALAKLLIRLGRNDDARAELERADVDLIAVNDAGRPLRESGGPLAEKYECLASSFRELGDHGRATELCDRANLVRARARRDHPDDRKRGFGRPPDGHHRHGGPPFTPGGPHPS